MQERNKEAAKTKSILPNDHSGGRSVDSGSDIKVESPAYVDIVEFYGKRGENMGYATLPYTLYYGETPLTRLYCHKKVAPAIEKAFQDTLDYYGIEKIKELGLDRFNGCFNNRLMRGSASKWSTHSWAISLDMYASKNKLKTPWKDCLFAQPEYDKWREIWKNVGAQFRGEVMGFDGMHLEFIKGKY